MAEMNSWQSFEQLKKTEPIGPFLGSCHQSKIFQDGC
jgi:hypothetical protein